MVLTDWQDDRLTDWQKECIDVISGAEDVRRGGMLTWWNRRGDGRGVWGGWAIRWSVGRETTT